MSRKWLTVRTVGDPTALTWECYRDTVIEQWGSERDFFVIVDGTADVYVGDEHVRSLGPGEFFGELAALDWGAGYGYSRLASVVAGSPLRLLVFAEGTLAELLQLPGVEREIRAAVQERLAWPL